MMIIIGCLSLAASLSPLGPAGASWFRSQRTTWFSPAPCTPVLALVGHTNKPPVKEVPT